MKMKYSEIEIWLSQQVSLKLNLFMGSKCCKNKTSEYLILKIARRRSAHKYWPRNKYNTEWYISFTKIIDPFFLQNCHVYFEQLLI